MRFVGLGFRVSGFGFRVSGFGFLVQSFGFRVSGFGFRVSGSGFRVLGFGFRVSGFGFRVSGSGLGFRVSGFGFRVYGSASGRTVFHLGYPLLPRGLPHRSGMSVPCFGSTVQRFGSHGSGSGIHTFCPTGAPLRPALPGRARLGMTLEPLIPRVSHLGRKKLPARTPPTRFHAAASGHSHAVGGLHVSGFDCLM